ncbi:MAG: hypothetical protein M1830_001057, partial [Pleopsidium flavum]
KKPQAAKGCFKVVVKDNTGALVVKLWYANLNYKLRLGLLVSVWTPHVSNCDPNSITLRNASLVTSVFPERDKSCYFMIHEQSDEGVLCRSPSGYKEGHDWAALMSLKNFVNGGSDVADALIMVCVKSIGARKKFTTKKGNPAEKLDIKVFDDTSEATLTLWGCVSTSAADWKPSHTILLISSPASKVDGRVWLSLRRATQVDVDPCMADADWLRAFARRLIKREHVNEPFPEGVYDTEAIMSSENRMLFNLAEVDDFARAAPSGTSLLSLHPTRTELLIETVMGYLNVILMELNLVTLHQRHMLFCTECCGVPLFANATTTRCKQCESVVALSINPRLVGSLYDETGRISCGKMIWSTEAWEHLLGRTAEELVSCNEDSLSHLENRMLFLRVTLLFGWSEQVEKLAVCQVMK